MLCELGLKLAAGLAIFGINRGLNDYPWRRLVGHIGDLQVYIAIPVLNPGKLQIGLCDVKEL